MTSKIISALFYAGLKSIETLRQKHIEFFAHPKSHTLDLWEKGETREIASEADKAAETTILDAINSCLQFEFNYLSEETNGIQLNNSNSPYLIIIDPLDGTIDFLSGLTNYGSMLGLMDCETGEILANMLFFPATQDAIVASKETDGVYYYNNLHNTHLHLVEADKLLAHPTLKFSFPDNNQKTKLSDNLFFTAHKTSPIDSHSWDSFSQYAATLSAKNIPFQLIDAASGALKAALFKLATNGCNTALVYNETKLWDTANIYLIASKAGFEIFNPKTGDAINTEDFLKQINSAINKGDGCDNTKDFLLPLALASTDQLKQKLLIRLGYMK